MVFALTINKLEVQGTRKSGFEFINRLGIRRPSLFLFLKLDYSRPILCAIHLP
jgi:hypothetical protein